MKDILRRLGQRIRDVRIQRGFASQEALADYLKMHRTFIGHLETGRKDFRLTTMIRVAEALDVTLAELFEGVEAGDVPKAKAKKRLERTERSALLKELTVLESSAAKLRAIVAIAAPHESKTRTK